MTELPILHEFRHSHYNEKARWALDHKGIAHRRVGLLPGPHARFLRRHTGQTQTPALRVGARWICGSTPILEWLEQQYPQRPLYPMDAGERAAVREWIRWLDGPVGWSVRVLGLGAMLDDASYLTRTLAGDRPAPVRWAYRAAMPVLRRAIAGSNGVTPQGTVRAEQEVRRALDRLGARLASHPWLVGDGFTAADLTAASLLAPLCALDHPARPPILPRPPALEALLARHADDPVCDWVRQTWRTQRPRDGAAVVSASR